MMIETLAAARERIEALEAEVAWLRQRVAEDVEDAQLAALRFRLGVTRSEARLLAILYLSGVRAGGCQSGL